MDDLSGDDDMGGESLVGESMFTDDGQIKHKKEDGELRHFITRRFSRILTCIHIHMHICIHAHTNRTYRTKSMDFSATQTRS